MQKSERELAHDMLVELKRAGVTFRDVASGTGVSENSIQDIAKRAVGKIRAETAAAIRSYHAERMSSSTMHAQAEEQVSREYESIARKSQLPAWGELTENMRSEVLRLHRIMCVEIERATATARSLFEVELIRMAMRGEP